MEISGPHASLAAILVAAFLSSCATVKDETAPCKRPTGLAFYSEDPRKACGPMKPINDPALAFERIGVIDGE